MIRVYIKSNYGLTGQLGAATYAVNVIGNVYSPSNNLIAVYLKDLLIREGWGITSLNVSSRGANVFDVVIKMNAIRNTAAELGRIEAGLKQAIVKAGLTGTMKAAFASSGVAPVRQGLPEQYVQQAKNVAQFSFQAKDVGYDKRIGLRSAHAAFNQLVTNRFPKLMYAISSTSYAEPVALGFYASSFVEASGETTLSPSDTKQTLINLMRQAGINTDAAHVQFSQKTYEQISNGDAVKPPSSVVAGGVGSLGLSLPGLPDLSNLGDGGFLGNLGAGLGLSTPIVGAGLLLLAIIVIRR